MIKISIDDAYDDDAEDIQLMMMIMSKYGFCFIMMMIVRIMTTWMMLLRMMVTVTPTVLLATMSRVMMGCGWRRE